MELLILPFCFPLFLVGWVVDFVAERRSRARLDPAEQRKRWRQTWFAYQGPPSEP